MILPTCAPRSIRSQLRPDRQLGACEAAIAPIGRERSGRFGRGAIRENAGPLPNEKHAAALRGELTRREVPATGQFTMRIDR